GRAPVRSALRAYVENEREGHEMIRSLCATVVSIFMAVVLVLVGGRFFALLTAANGNSGLVKAIYRHSDFWVKPFFGMFGLSNGAVQGGGVFEPASLIALIVYLVAGTLVLGVLSGAVTHRSAVTVEA